MSRAINPIHNSLAVTICKNAEDAVGKGFNYSYDSSFKPISIKNVVVVQEGTEQGNSTVDFVLEDEVGNKFVFMVTGRLLKSIPC